MGNIVVLGVQWGDEGKGKIVDLLSEHVDIVARYQGGHNAGHTVMVGEERVVLHLIPTGILRPHKKCILGNGVVIDPRALIEEMTGLQKLGVNFEQRLFISQRAHLIMPYHNRADQKDSQATGLRHIGTTGRGIGPAYTDKMAREGIQAGDLLNEELFREKLRLNLEKRELNQPSYAEQLFSQYMEYAQKLKPYLADTSCFINDALDKKQRVLFEGAQGTMLDVDHGTYPYVTSSNATAGGACSGLGVGPTRIDGVLGVVKAYTTRVGNGPFPTEIKDQMGEKLRSQGDEYGATTGRPRRCGWFDAIAVRHAVRINGIESLALTKLDVLDKCDRIKICTGYEWQGKRLEQFPANIRVVEQCKPIYEEIPGWMADTRNIDSVDAFPAATRKYLDRIQELTGIELALISTGPHREQTIINKGTKLTSWLDI
jgi:adenylosuccinate synthase